MIAQSDDGVMLRSFEEENDVLMGDFEESYKNLALKHFYGLLWARSNCPDNTTIIKMDDDIAVNLPKMMKKSQTIENMAGWVHQAMPVRRRASKWSLSKEEFKGDTYPDFLSGWAYAMTMHTAKKILDVGLESDNKLWIDDVWITGMLRSEANIRGMTSWSQWYTPYVEHLQCCLKGFELECDFIAAPSNGQAQLIESFGSHSRHCSRTGCPKRKTSLLSTCYVPNPLFLPDSGGIGHVMNAG